jgi:CelD/BcsL family acetyltransferase involved in cellulose biosynthesis
LTGTAWRGLPALPKKCGGGIVLSWTETCIEKQAAIDYEVLTNSDDIASISQEWDRLLTISRCNRAFSCSKWYLTTPDLLPELQPLVLIGRRNGVIAGIMPLWLDVGRRTAGFPEDFSDHLDIIAPDEDLDVVTGLLTFVMNHARDYGKLCLGHIKPDSNCVRGAQALGLLEAGGIFTTGKLLPYAVLDLTCGYDGYMKTLSRNTRHNLNRMLKMAGRDGFIISELTPEYLEPERLPAIFLSLHESRFKRTSLKTISKSPEAWIQHLFPSLFAEKRMRVFALLKRDRILGIDLNMVARSGMYAWNGGFLPELGQYDPGKLLIHKVIEQSCREGLAEYDLGWFGQEHKARWRPFVRQIGELQFDVTSKNE